MSQQGFRNSLIDELLDAFANGQGIRLGEKVGHEFIMVGHHLRRKRNNTRSVADPIIILLWLKILFTIFCVTPTSSSTALIGFWLLAKPMKSHGTVRPCSGHKRIHVRGRVGNKHEHRHSGFQSYLYAHTDQRRRSCQISTTRLPVRLGATYLVQQLVKAVLSVGAGLSEVDFSGFER